MNGSERVPRVLLLVGLCVVMFVAGGAVAWALVTLLRPAVSPVDTAAYTYATVTRGQIESTVRLDTTTRWTTKGVGVNRSAGVVTGVSDALGQGDANQGDVLYSVDLRPVVVAQGDVPAFRSITVGESGEDVAQLQGMLTALGYYGKAITGKVDAATQQAIRLWQGGLGVERTGVVQAGDVIFVPHLPANLVLNTSLIVRGATLMGGENVVSQLPTAPSFSILASGTQAAMVQSGYRVEITAPDGDLWQATTADQVVDSDTGFVNINLAGSGDTPICGSACGSIPVVGQTVLASTIVTMEPVSGLLVPSASLLTQAGGQLIVITESGERVPVDIVASSKGMSIVTGVTEGLKVRIPAS